LQSARHLSNEKAPQVDRGAFSSIGKKLALGTVPAADSDLRGSGIVSHAVSTDRNPRDRIDVARTLGRDILRGRMFDILAKNEQKPEKCRFCYGRDNNFDTRLF